jgi:hypothetical protein
MTAIELIAGGTGALALLLAAREFVRTPKHVQAVSGAGEQVAKTIGATNMALAELLAGVTRLESQIQGVAVDVAKTHRTQMETHMQTQQVMTTGLAALAPKKPGPKPKKPQETPYSE